jgi:hypothetical protein
MYQAAYAYDHPDVTRYTFTSVGRKRIEKIVEFTELGYEKVFNLAFGDLMADGSVDDRSNSNNGDIVKVLATVISILKDFTSENPGAYVAFTGSTEERMKLYTRILKSYYSVFNKEFKISGFIKAGDDFKEVQFDPKSTLNYTVFLIKRIV